MIKKENSGGGLKMKVKDLKDFIPTFFKTLMKAIEISIKENKK